MRAAQAQTSPLQLFCFVVVVVVVCGFSVFFKRSNGCCFSENKPKKKRVHTKRKCISSNLKPVSHLQLLWRIALCVLAAVPTLRRCCVLLTRVAVVALRATAAPPIIAAVTVVILAAVDV